MAKIKIDKADKAFSTYIRTRDKWTCQRCGTKYHEGHTKGLENSHFFGRARENTRFDPENCDALCTGCHFHWGAYKEGYRAFKIKQLGEKGFQLLTLRASIYKKKDRKMSYLIAKQLLKDLKWGVPFDPTSIPF